MNIKGEEVFFVDYDPDPRCSMLYAPLRSYLAIVTNDLRDAVVAGNEVARRVVYGRVTQRPLINIRAIHEQIRCSDPELVLELTDDCNLACRYCHASAGDGHKTRSLERDVVNAAIQRFFEIHQASDVSIGFAGGEPTYAGDLFIHAVSYAKSAAARYGVRCIFRMATNGCYGRRMREFVIEHFSEVSLSFDGPAHIQNLHRPLRNGKPSFPTVFRTAKYFYDARFPFAFRATVSAYSLPHLIQVADFFASNFPGKHVGLEPLNPFGRGARPDTQAQLGSPPRQEFADALLRVIRAFEGQPISFENAGVAKCELLRTVFCKAVAAPSWTLRTDGSVSACSRDNAPDVFTIGRFDEGKCQFLIDEEKVRRLEAQNVFQFGECDGCFCKYHCAGDCLDLRLSGLRDCSVNRQVGKYHLLKKIRALRSEQAIAMGG